MVGGVKIGLAGLDGILAQVASESLDSEGALAERLLELVRRANYVAPSRTEEYKKALLKEYKRFRGDEVPPEPGAFEIRVLGPGCPRCDRLMDEVLAVLDDLGVAADIEHVRDLDAIAGFGPAAVPALVINGKVVLSGRVPSRARLVRIVEEARR